MDIDNTTILITKGEYNRLIEASVRNSVLLEYIRGKEYWNKADIFCILGDNDGARREKGLK